MAWLVLAIADMVAMILRRVSNPGCLQVWMPDDQPQQISEELN